MPKLSKIGSIACTIVALSVLGACGPSSIGGRDLNGTSAAPLSLSVQHEGPTIRMSAQSTFKRGASYTLNIMLDSPVATEAVVELAVSPNIPLEQHNLRVSLEPHQPKTIKLHGTLKRAGYHTITASARSADWLESPSDMIGLNVVSLDNTPLGTSNAALPQGGVQTPEDYVASLPVVTDNALHVEQIKADLEGRDNVRLDYIHKGATFTRMDGTMTAPEDMVISYHPGSTGTPSAGELEGKPDHSKDTRFRPMGCTTQLASIKIDLLHNFGTPPTPYLGRRYPLNRYWVRVVDDNGGFWSHWVIAEGATDDNGVFYYNQPTCEASGDSSSGPDLYFLIEARIPNTPTSGVLKGIRIQNTWSAQYFVQTPTEWDTTTTNRVLHLDTVTSLGDQSLWMAKMVQFSEDFNFVTGGARMGIAVFWPATLVTEGSAYSPVARVVMHGSFWQDTDPIVHEYGHNVKYLDEDSANYASCLGLIVPCDPHFAALTDYSHSASAATTEPKAMNEGFANFYYEMAREYFDTWPRNGEVVKTAWSRWMRDCTELCTIATGAKNETRVASFLYQYTTKVLARGNPALYMNAMSALRSAMSGVRRYDLGFYDYWNSYLRFSLPPSTVMLPDPCTGGTSSAPTVVRCLMQKHTLTEKAVSIP